MPVSPALLDRPPPRASTASAMAIAHLPQAICLFDHTGRLLLANRPLARLFALEPAALQPGLPIQLVLAHARATSNLHPDDIGYAAQCLKRLVARNKEASFPHTLRDGRTITLTFSPIPGEGWLVTIAEASTTDRPARLAVARLAHDAHHDTLTGLANRALFHQRLRDALAEGRPCAVLCLDLDHFKQVNDTLGHGVGDTLLRAVADQLRRLVGALGTVARIGGDEFAIVQPGATSPAEAYAAAALLSARIIDQVRRPQWIEGRQVQIGVSIGIAVLPKDGQGRTEALRNADLALYRAKADGGNRHCRYEPTMDASMQARRRLEQDLRAALAADDFELFYQPQMDVQSRTVAGFEALLRWRHPKRGLLAPAAFVPLAEEIGLGAALGKWVLHRACADAATWPGQYTVAINLSAAHVASRALVRHVGSALARSGIDAGRVELEITEAVMLKGSDTMMETLQGLRSLGVSVAIDDYGAGLSSLHALRRFPFSKIKIHRSFIEGLGRGGEDDIIVGALTTLCNRLGLRCTAEGVETEDQFARLQAGRCSEVQGFLFSRPTPAADVSRLCQALSGLEDGAAPPG